MNGMVQSLLLLFLLSCLFLAAVTSGELVKKWHCYVFNHQQAHCAWTPDSHARDLRFFYWLKDEGGGHSINDPSPVPSYQECSSYSYSESFRTGCDLQAKITDNIVVYFNGTLNNLPDNYTSEKEVEVRPPVLTWTVQKTRDAFNISWISPNISRLSSWKFTIKYTECNKTKEPRSTVGKTSLMLRLVPHCQYSIAIKAQKTGGKPAETPWSAEKYFDADTDPNAWVYAAIIIPLMFAGLAALTCVCCRKNKENIFPKVPEPRDLLSDISDNNNKSTVHNLYVPAEEEDNCKITLVIDPKSNNFTPDTFLQ